MVIDKDAAEKKSFHNSSCGRGLSAIRVTSDSSLVPIFCLHVKTSSAVVLPPQVTSLVITSIMSNLSVASLNSRYRSSPVVGGIDQ